MRTSIILIFMSVGLICMGQVKPCYQEKRICDNRKIANCHKLVLFTKLQVTIIPKKIPESSIQVIA